MKKVIDLSVFETQTMEVRLNGDKVLQLQKPTQAMVIEMMKFRNIDEKTDEKDIVAAIDKLTLMVLNSNDKVEKFTLLSMNKLLNTQQKIALLTAYSEYISEVQSDPN